jgi:NADH-quinone oxidoreductase subunit L
VVPVAAILALILPLLGFVFHVAAGRYVSRGTVETVACAAVLGSLIAACLALAAGWGQAGSVTLFPWFRAGGFAASYDLLLDPLSLLMAVLVGFVSLLVHCYSIPFMRWDPGYIRYYGYLNLFVFFMLAVALADNLVFLFLGWEGMGFCSYALIGHWFHSGERTAAARKAFLVTRTGDVAFLIGVALLFAQGVDPSVSGIQAAAGSLPEWTAVLLGLLLLWAAAGKSAQFPLLVWLPEAMAGPTPVSALIHAATMAASGVYLLARLFPVLALSPAVLFCIGTVGTLTALWGAASALAQRDIKRVLAWSTLSQVGFMMLAIGAGDPAASMFHLIVHAFFKSLLFLAAGCLIQALGEEHDIFAMGARLRHRLPGVFWPFLLGVIALAAVPPFAGFWSKGRVLSAVLAQPGAGYAALALAASAAALLTSLYAFRLLLVAFFGRPARTDAPRPESVPGSMTKILWPLALLCIAAGALDLPGHWGAGNWLTGFLASARGVPSGSDGVSETLIVLLDSGLALAGLLLALLAFGPAERFLPRAPVGARLWSLMARGFGLDGAYERLLARPYRYGATLLWLRMEEGVLQTATSGAAALFGRASSEVRLWTTGRLSTYLLMLLAGLALILLIATGMRS